MLPDEFDTLPSWRPLFFAIGIDRGMEKAEGLQSLGMSFRKSKRNISAHAVTDEHTLVDAQCIDKHPDRIRQGIDRRLTRQEGRVSAAREIGDQQPAAGAQAGSYFVPYSPILRKTM